MLIKVYLISIKKKSKINFIIVYVYVRRVQYFECALKIVFTSNVFLLDLANCTVLLHTLHFYIDA